MSTRTPQTPDLSRRRANPGRVGPTGHGPGDRPEGAQGRPARPPLRTRARRRPTQTARFPFAFDRRMMPFALLLGIVPATARVELDAVHLRIRFGAWHLITPLDNVAGVRVTGPYRLLRAVGPPRLSLVDGGITFATGAGPGAYITFREPVPAALPVPLVRHPAATVTVLEPEAFAETLLRRMTI